MAHPFPIKEIARQSGLSEATVDRVLNGRGGVRGSTAREVRQAIADLGRQQASTRLAGRTFIFDVVMQAPERFTSAVRDALEAELPSLRPATVRSRFHFRETGPVAELVATLERIARRGSQGVIVKAPDVPEVSAAASRLAAARIPAVTLVTDLPSAHRLAYVGIDNRDAGATAAYLVERFMAGQPGDVLVTISRGSFRGEEEREMGFRAAMRTMRPDRSLVEVTDSDGLDATQRDLVLAALESNSGIKAVYSTGGGNTATVEAFDLLGRGYDAFIAHDLDRDNTRLLRTSRLSAVLYHDLRQDMRRACQILMGARSGSPEPVRSRPSGIQVITPYNIPPELLEAILGG